MGEERQQDSRGRASSLLSGRVCVVSGAGRGLGRSIACALASHGADLVVAARRPEPLEALAAEVRERGGRVLVVPADITVGEDCARLADTVKGELGGIDVLVNNAVKFDVFQPFARVDLEAWRGIVDTNLFGSLQMTKAVLPSMKARGGGSVVMVSSMVLRKPFPLEGGYAVSKGALVTATRVLASELGADHVRVNALVPGWMWSPAVRSYVEGTARQRQVTVDEVKAEIAQRIPLGAIPTLDQVAGAAVFLASDLSAVVTGQTLDANGGEIFA